MAGNIGLKIGIDGEAEYKKKLSNIIQEAKALAAEMDNVSKSFDDNAESEDNARKKSDILKDAVANQTKKVDLLQEMVNKATDKYGENATETLKLKEALYKAEGKEKDLEKQQKELTDVTEEGTEAVEQTTDKWDKFKEVAGKVGEAFGVAVVAIGTAAVGLGKAVVDSYGELEQNLGGAEAVYVKYADDIVKVSQDAYKTMGVSQSDYLASANKTAALFQGSGVTQQRSLELTTQAMQRAADMASVMGIDTDEALNAITGAAKGNYTMMDNLGVAMNATTLQAYAVSQGMTTAFASMTQAEKAELAMQYFFENTTQYAGNFEREATQTISGSFGMLSASVDTFVAGLGDQNADIGALTQNVIDSFVAVVDNVTPILQNLIKAVPDAAQTIVNAVGEILPDLLTVAVDVFNSVLLMLIDTLPELIPVVISAIGLIVSTIIDNLPAIIDGALEIILALANGIGEALPTLIPAIVDCILTIVDNLTKPNSISMIIDAAICIMEGLIYGILDAIPMLIERVPDIIIQFVGAILENLPKLLESGAKMLMEIIAGILKSLPEIGKAIGKLVSAVKDALFGNGGAKFKQWGSDMINGIVNGIKASIGKVKDAAKSVANTISSWLHFSVPDKGPLRDVPKWMPDMIDTMVNGIESGERKLNSAMYDMSFGMADSVGAGYGRGSITNMGGVNITVNAAAGQSEQAIADAVMERMQRVYEGRVSTWA